MLRSALPLAALLMFTSSHAAVYNAAADFTPATSANPNGVWLYGYDAAGDSGSYALVAFDLFTGSASAPFWQKSGYITSGTPAFFKAQTTPLNGVAVGQVALHPGPATGFVNDDAAILRFTAPSTGLYAVNSQFFVTDSGVTTAWVVRNNNFASPLAALGSTNSNPSYIAPSLLLNAGDTLDFVVGNAGSFFGDTTALNVTISVVPEPQAWALWAAGLAALGSAARRRGQ